MNIKLIGGYENKKKGIDILVTSILLIIHFLFFPEY